jgi:hypothetical protein
MAADRAAVETAAQLVRDILDGTPWHRTWIGGAPELIVESTGHLTLRMGGVRHSGRGGYADMHPDERAILYNLAPLPTTSLEAAELLRRVLSHFFDHELREFMRGAEGRPLFDPHSVGDAVPGADRRFSAPGG